MLRDERLDGLNEMPRDRLHEGRRRPRVAAVLAEEVHHAAYMLELRHIHVEVHPVDALDFQRDVLAQDLGDAPW